MLQLISLGLGHVGRHRGIKIYSFFFQTITINKAVAHRKTDDSYVCAFNCKLFIILNKNYKILRY